MEVELPKFVHRRGWLVVAFALAAAYTYVTHAWFRANWAWIVGLAPRKDYLFAFAAVTLHLIQVIVSNLGMAVVYAANVPWLEQYKISKKPWPWRSPKQEERDRFWSTFRWSLAVVSFNSVVIALPSAILTYNRFAPLGVFDFRQETFPDIWTVVWQTAVCACVEDTMFYWTHRFLHTKWIYPHIHKWHHTYYHSITLASENAHPVEYLLGNLIPTLAGPLLLRSHTFTTWFWISIRIFESCDAHCGYEFPWSPARLMPFAGSAEAHDYHHSHNKGCFGSQFALWDTWCGTDRDYVTFVAKEHASPTGIVPGDIDGVDAVEHSEPGTGTTPAAASGGKDGDGVGPASNKGTATGVASGRGSHAVKRVRSGKTLVA